MVKAALAVWSGNVSPDVLATSSRKEYLIEDLDEIVFTANFRLREDSTW